MEAQIPRQHGHNGDEQLPVMQGEGHDHEHHEKKSVMKNVKDKARSKVRKIKETLTKHGHGGHGHEHEQHDRDRQSHEDDDDDDEEELVDPEVHDAPMYESATARNGVGTGHQPGDNLEKPTIMEEDRYKDTIPGTQTKPFSQAEYIKPEHGEPTRPVSQAEHAKPVHGQFKNLKHGIDQENLDDKVGVTSQMTKDRHDTSIDPQTRPFSQGQHTKPEHEQFRNIEHGIDRIEENPKDQIGIPSEMEQDRCSTITDPQNRPFSQPEHEKMGHGQLRSIERGIDESQGNPRVNIGTPTRMEEDPNVPKDGQKPSNYQSKVTDPAGAGGAEARITPILHSFDKLSVSDEPHPLPKSDDFDSPPEIFTGTHNQFSPESIPENAPVEFKDPGSPVIALTSGGEKQSSYTDKISSATSTLTGNAIAAKDIVASKLGYGEKEGSEVSSTGEKEGSGIANTGEKEGFGISETGKGGPSGGVTATVADYANRAAATVTSVGSSMLSKEQGGPTGENKETNNATEQTVENKGTSKGVTSYLAEKLRPSKEDKALSEVISDSLYRKKPESDDKPIGKVTVSDEVAKKLGTREDVKRENESVDAQVVGDVRPDVVGRVKGWFGIGQSQSPQASQTDTNAANDPISSSEAGEARKLQESTN